MTNYIDRKGNSLGLPDPGRRENTEPVNWFERITWGTLISIFVVTLILIVWVGVAKMAESQSYWTWHDACIADGNFVDRAHDWCVDSSRLIVSSWEG